MSRRFLRSFFDFHDPFHIPSFIHQPIRVQLRRLRPVQAEALQPKNTPKNAHQIFQNFFNEHGIKEESEKNFFKKNFPEKYQEQFDPYKILEIPKQASEQQIKDAYRKLAIKYHPKNNTSPQAEQKFNQLGRAYSEVIQSRNNARFSDWGVNSFFEEFDKGIQENYFNFKEQKANKLENGKKSEQTSGTDSLGELYSQSSHIQNVNGRQTKYVIEKKYKNEGKLFSVKRQQTLKDDGTTEIYQTIDDGKQIRKKTYQLDKDKKETKKIEEEKQ